MSAILKAVNLEDAFRKAKLTVNADQAGAISLYWHFGFQVIGEKTRVMGDGNIYLGYIMEKDSG